MTDHPGQRLLNAYLDGEVERADALLVEEHLSGCSECSDTINVLARAAARLRTMSPVEPTPDEHRELRQAILSSRSPARPSRLGSLQWALAGGMVLALIASVGFLFLARPSPERATDAASGADGSGLPQLDTAEDVERFVSSLPAVASARSQGSGGSGGGGEAAGDSGAYSGGTTSESAESGLADDAISEEAPRTLAREEAQPDSAQEDAADGRDPLAATGPESCADRLATLQADPVDLLTQTDVVYRGRPALLVVYASKPAGLGGDYDRMLSLIVPEDRCAELTGPDLSGAVLFRSESSF
ncbi:MAG: anti-sigma factor [Actinomycetota bacterium]